MLTKDWKQSNKLRFEIAKCSFKKEREYKKEMLKTEKPHVSLTPGEKENQGG